MRRCQLLYSIIICSICLLLSSCNSWFDFTSEKWDAEPSDTIFTVNRDHFEFSSNQSEEQLIIHSNVNWNISKVYGWCHVTPDLSGEGDKTLTVSCDNNTTSKDRYDTIQIKTASETKRIPIFQSGSTYYIVPSTPRLEYGIAGGIKSFTVSSNTDWVPSLLHGGLGTLKQNGNELTLTAYENTTAEVRYDTILIAATNPDIQVQAFVYVYQDGLEPKLEVTPDSLKSKPLQFGSDTGTGSFNIESNLNWELTCKCKEEDWCHITSNKTGTGNGTVSLSVDQNPLGAKARDAVVTITTSALTKKVNIHQAPGEKPVLKIIPSTLDTLKYENTGGTNSFTVESNVDWSVTCSDNSWCHIETPSGNVTGNGEVKVNVDVNPAEAPERSCTLKIKSSWFDDKTVTVHQKKGDAGYVRVSNSTLNAKPQGETLTFNIESNLSNWTVYSNHPDWCDVNTPSGSFNGTVELSVGLNSGSDARDATITIKSVISDVTVTVHQEPKDIPGGGDNPNPSYSRKR